MESHPAILQWSNIAGWKLMEHLHLALSGTVYGQDCGPWRSKEWQGGDCWFDLWICHGGCHGLVRGFKPLSFNPRKLVMVKDGWCWAAAHHIIQRSIEILAQHWHYLRGLDFWRKCSRYNAAALLRNWLMIRTNSYFPAFIIPFLS